jgi:hypothetical protein
MPQMMRFALISLALGVLGALGGCGRPPDAGTRGGPAADPAVPGDPAAAPSAVPAPLLPQVTLRPTAPHRTEMVPAAPYDLHRIGALEVAVAWPAAIVGTTAREQTIEVYAPGGELYQSYTRPLPSDGSTPTLSSTLPIAGTQIEKYNLSGVWRIQVRLNDHPQPLAQTTFELR